MRKLIIACVSLLLLSNIVVLAGVAYNRAGEPVASIELTERELPLRQTFSSTDENSGTALTLDWQLFDGDEDPKFYLSRYNSPIWLDDKKLNELGFDIEEIKSNKDKYQFRTSQLTADVVVVLEYQGESYRKTIELAENKAERLRSRAEQFPEDKKEQNTLINFEKRLSRLKTSESRLFAIDAGLDQQALMQKYSDKSKYLFARGEIGLSWHKKYIGAYIQQLYIREIHVPLPFSDMLAGYAPKTRYRDKATSPRYKVQLNIGQRLEPWVTAVSKI